MHGLLFQLVILVEIVVRINILAGNILVEVKLLHHERVGNGCHLILDIVGTEMTCSILAERYLQFLTHGINRSLCPLRSIDNLHISVGIVCLHELRSLVAAENHISLVHLEHQAILRNIDYHRVGLCLLDNQLGVARLA